jgi:hypothetical protein
MLPFPGMPYGPAPVWCFPAFEVSAYLLFLLCLIHAACRGKQPAMYLLGGLAFGLILEYIEVITGSYTYGHFWSMLGHPPLAVPICIGLGWGIILYTARLFSDALRLPPLTAAAFDTLLAYRLHMWHWYWTGSGLNPLTAQWFGIPYGNFIGWETVVFCYSLFSRVFERRLHRSPVTTLRAISIALLALICSQVILFSTETFLYPFLRAHLHVSSLDRFIAISAALLAITLWGWRKRHHPGQPIPSIARWVPCWFHAFFLIIFFTMGFYRENRWMTVIACLNVAIGIVLHLLPWHERGTPGVQPQLNEHPIHDATGL